MNALLRLHLPPEVPVLSGLLVPAPLVVGLLAMVVSVVILHVLDRFNLARYVWHPPLFTLAFMGLMYVFLGLWLLPR